MNGMNASTGKHLEGMAHLRQSITDILSTPIGSRVMRREYGSNIRRLIDAPVNRAILLEIYAASAEAIARWEPRFLLSSVTASSAQPGQIVLDFAGEYLPDGQTIIMNGIIVDSGRGIKGGSNNLISQQVIINEVAIVTGAEDLGT